MATAKLSQKEIDALKSYDGPFDVLDLTKFGWEKNILQKRRNYHETAQRTMSQVLGVLATVEFAITLVSKL